MLFFSKEFLTCPTPPLPPPTPAKASPNASSTRSLRLQKRLDKAERRTRIERALADAQATDIHAAADELEHETETDDLPGAVRRLKRKNPGLFAQPSDAPSPANLPQPGGTQRPDQHLTILREKARQGDRASLLLYLRARRDKA
ncbi:MAG: hypothetical protein QM783_19430 [Phycisphaerales bacterium]